MKTPDIFRLITEDPSIAAKLDLLEADSRERYKRLFSQEQKDQFMKRIQKEGIFVVKLDENTDFFVFQRRNPVLKWCSYLQEGSMHYSLEIARRILSADGDRWREDYTFEQTLKIDPRGPRYHPFLGITTSAVPGENLLGRSYGFDLDIGTRGSPGFVYVYYKPQGEFGYCSFVSEPKHMFEETEGDDEEIERRYGSIDNLVELAETMISDMARKITDSPPRFRPYKVIQAHDELLRRGVYRADGPIPEYPYDESELPRQPLARTGRYYGDGEHWWTVTRATPRLDVSLGKKDSERSSHSELSFSVPRRIAVEELLRHITVVRKDFLRAAQFLPVRFSLPQEGVIFPDPFSTVQRSVTF